MGTHTLGHRAGRWLGIGAGLLALACAVPLQAQDASGSNDVNMLLLDTLLKNGAITQSQYDTLKKQEQSRAAARATPVAAAPQPKAASATKSDSDFTFNVGGRLQLDAGFFNSDKTHIGSGQEARRMRFDITGKIYHDWEYGLSYDFASSDEIKNAYLSYVGFKNTALTVGYFKLPFSLEYQTSSKNTEFQERSLLHDTFDPPKRVGIGLDHHGLWGTGSYTASVGVFGEEIPSDTESGGDSGIGVAGRVTYAFVHTRDRLLHIGANAEWRNPGDGEVVRLQSRPDAHLASRLVDTSAIPDVDDDLKVGGEFAAVTGPLAFQGQYVSEQVRRGVGSNLNFDGWYVQGSYFLTGESRAAFYKGGRFGGVKPHGPNGAWQLGLRYDTVDLIDGGFNGGREANVTAALNWYINKYLRFSMNYVKVMKLDRPGNVHDDDKPDMVIARMWLGF